MFGILFSHCFIKGTAYFVQVNQRYIFFGCQPTNRIRIIKMSVYYFTILIKTTTLGRSYQYRLCASGTCFININLQIIHEKIKGSFAWSLLFLIVMPKLHKKIITLLHLRQRFLQTPGTNKSIGRFSGFCIIGNSYLIGKPTRKHLSPGSPRLIIIVHYGGVATEKDSRHFIGTFNNQRGYARCITIKFKRQFFIPVQLILFARLDFDFLSFTDFHISFVDGKRFSNHFSLPGRKILNQQSAGLGTYCCIPC